jgi:hypothetical protein
MRTDRDADSSFIGSDRTILCLLVTINLAARRLAAKTAIKTTSAVKYFFSFGKFIY